jgi:general secretion pathway protein D
VRFVPVRYMEATPLAQQVTSLLAAKAKAQGETGGNASGLEIAPDARSNQLVLVGAAPRLDEAMGLIRAFDVPLGLETATYSLKHTSPERVDRLARQLINPIDAKRLYQSATDAENGVLMVTTTPEIHAQIRTLTTRLDMPPAKGQNPIRFYTLRNTTVDHMMETLRAIEDTDGSASTENSEGRTAQGPAGRTSAEGAIHLPLAAGQVTPANWSGGEKPSRGNMAGSPRHGAGRIDGVFPGGAKITADQNTNSLIVLADPPIQRVYEELITSLDRRRPQVLIEAKIISVDTTDNFSLGVEIGRSTNSGLRQLLTFSSFGLSAVNPVSGALALTPGTGFNGALVDPNLADAVLHTLSGDSHTRVLASPRVLVNDNSKGQLESVLSVPFASVNASQTVATTSVGGNQDAGTTITVTPHISEGDHLQLEFAIEFSSFGSGGNANLPPPRHIDKVQSTVTIPDGHTVIVGGLNRDSHSESHMGLPILGNIPGLGLLFSNRSRDSEIGSVFVFIRPTILRDDKFKDLKFLSEHDAKDAKTPGQFPASEPLLMH